MSPPTQQSAPSSSRGALSGIRIVEFAGIGPGPFAAMLLADMGAEVIRIDRPGAETCSRSIVGRGRPTLTLDLKTPESVAAALDLIAGADALIEGYRPGVMERLGLGPKVALARNPRLVYGRMTGWGQDGPLAHAAGHDINYIALTGALSAIGPRNHPVPPLNLVGDYGGGALYLVMGLLAGIISATRTGQGQVVDAAICDGTASLMSIIIDFAARGQWSDDRASNRIDGGAPFYRTYECSDGRHIAVGALEPQFYALLCEKAGLDHPDFSHRDDGSVWPALHRNMEAVFKTRTRDEWSRLLEGTDACFAPVMTLSEAPHHRHLVARETFIEVDGVQQPAPAPRFSGTPSRIGSWPTSKIDVATALARWATPELEPKD